MADYSRRWLRYAAVFVLALVMAACTAAPQPPPASARLPPSPGVKLTSAQLENADPCGFLHSRQAYSYAPTQIGPIGGYPGAQFTSCTGTLDLFDHGSANVGLGIETKLASLGGEPFTTSQRQGVTVYRDSGAGLANLVRRPACQEEVVATGDATISLVVSGEVRGVTPCGIADSIMDVVVKHLLAADLPTVTYAENSLARQDACQAVRPEDITQLPGVGQTRQDQGYRGQSCEWSDSNKGKPLLSLTFDRGQAPYAIPGLSRGATIAGHQATVSQIPAKQGGLPACGIELRYRPLDQPGPPQADSELIHLDAYVDAPPDKTCSTLIDLADRVVTRLRPA